MVNYENRHLITVVIPTYNRALTIERAVKSVITQTYKNLEIIIVDDASTDNTCDILNKLEIENNIHIIKHEQNMGGSVARNTGIYAAKGEYIAFLDSDDEWLPNKLSEQMKIIRKDKEVGMVYTNYYLVDQDTNKIMSLYTNKHINNVLYNLLFCNFIGSTSTILVKKDCMMKICGFDANLPSCQDWDIYIRIAHLYKIVGIDEPLIKYYIHNNSITGSQEKSLMGHEIVLNKILEIAENSSIYKNKLNKIKAVHTFNLAHIMLRFDEFEKARKYFIKALLLYPYNFRYFTSVIVSLFGENTYFYIKKYFNILRKLLRE